MEEDAIHVLKIIIEHAHNLLRSLLFAVSGEAVDIGKEHRDFALAHRSQRRLARVAQQNLHHCRRNIAPEQAAHVVLAMGLAPRPQGCPQRPGNRQSQQ